MYKGSKNGAGTYQTIINWLPPHEVYIEPFLGSGAILNNKKPASKRNIGIEIDPATIAKFSYNSCAEIINDCGITYLKELPKDRKDILIYADPPYPKQSIKSEKNLYGHIMTNKEHEKLLEILLSMKSRVAISTYKNDIYSDMLSSWNCIEYKSMTRQGLATELLYMNYPKPIRLHDYGFLGQNFTDRQRIKRKIKRHVNVLDRLPILERNAILDGINRQSY